MLISLTLQLNYTNAKSSFKQLERRGYKISTPRGCNYMIHSHLKMAYVIKK
jgi:hypothetical protein